MHLVETSIARVVGSKARRLWICVAAAVLAAAICMTALPQTAFAAGGVTCADELSFLGSGTDEGRVSPEPGLAYLLYVQFDKNVSYAAPGKDDAFVEENLSKVHLVGPDGAEVAGSYVGGAHDHSDRQLIYVYCDEWLQPAAEYQVVVDAGIVAANGEDELGAAKVYTFTTSDELQNGWAIHELAVVGAVAIALIAGVCVQVVRVARRNR